MNQIFFIISLFLILNLNVIGCSWNKDSQSKKTVLKTENSIMSAEEFAKLMAEKLSIYDALTAKDPLQISRVKSEIERDFIVKAIIENWAKKENLRVEPSEVEGSINKVRESFPNDLAFRQELSKQNISFSDWQNKMAYGVLEKKVFQKLTLGMLEPTELEIQNYYDSNKTKYSHKEKILLRQIVLSNESAADKIQEALKTNKNFETLAKSFSTTPEGKNGGLVGWVEKGMLEVFDNAFALPLSTSSATFISPYGFHIFRVENKLPAGHQPLSEVKKSIIKTLLGQREQALFRSWIDKEIRQIHIYKDHKMIQAMAVETRGNQ